MKGGHVPISDRTYRPSYDPEISKLFFAMCLIIPASIILALLLYAEPFHLWHNAFSQLGETVTASGVPNVASRLVFSAGWIACGIVMLMIAARYGRNRALRLRALKGWLALLGGIGFFIAITPNDLNHLLHSIGMGIGVGVMYFFAILLLFELRPRISRWVFLANVTLLHAVVLTYAVAFFANSDHKQLAQKLCILGLLLVMERMVTIAPEGFEWRSVFEALRRSSK